MEAQRASKKTFAQAQVPCDILDDNCYFGGQKMNVLSLEKPCVLSSKYKPHHPWLLGHQSRSSLLPLDVLSSPVGQRTFWLLPTHMNPFCLFDASPPFIPYRQVLPKASPGAFFLLLGPLSGPASQTCTSSSHTPEGHSQSLVAAAGSSS
jgi:hypothetical protein